MNSGQDPRARRRQYVEIYPLQCMYAHNYEGLDREKSPPLYMCKEAWNLSSLLQGPDPARGEDIHQKPNPKKPKQGKRRNKAWSNQER